MLDDVRAWIEIASNEHTCMLTALQTYSGRQRSRFRYIPNAMSDKDGMMLVKDERKHSPTYCQAALYAEDSYTHQLSNEQLLYNDDPLHAATRQYQWTDAAAANVPLMNSGKGIDDANLCIQ